MVDAKRENNKNRIKQQREIWVKKWIAERITHGAYNSLIQEWRSTDPTSYHNFLRMDPESFDLLLAKASPLIAKEDTRLRQSTAIFFTSIMVMVIDAFHIVQAWIGFEQCYQEKSFVICPIHALTVTGR